MNIKIKGVPSNIGALNTGTELAPAYLRQAGLIEKLSLNHKVTDLGDVELPSDLIRHNVAPVRNWPSPKIVWQETSDQLSGCFEDSTFTLVIGGGCSIFTGVFSHFHALYGKRAKILSVDHHIDVKEPNSEICMGSTAYTHYFLTSENQWYTKPNGFTKESFTAYGYSEDTLTEGYDVSGMSLYSKENILIKGVDVVVSESLSQLIEEDRLIIHLDLDVICEKDLASVYMPSPQGLEMVTVEKLLKGLVSDPRVVGLVVTEFSGAYSTSKGDAKKVVNLISNLFDS